MTNDEPKTLGDAIRFVRNQNQLTQAQVAKLAGVASNTLARIERSELTCSLETLESIATALEIPSAFLAILGSEVPSNKVIGGTIRNLKQAVNVAMKVMAEQKPAASSGAGRGRKTPSGRWGASGRSRRQ